MISPPFNSAPRQTTINTTGPGATLFPYNAVTPSVTWNIAHNGNTTTVFVQIYDAAGDMILPDEVSIIDANNVTVSFSTPQDGKAVLLLA